VRLAGEEVGSPAAVTFVEDVEDIQTSKGISNEIAES
jgi:hypothetical protein